MHTYTLDTTYYAGTTAMVDFPEGKTWEDVESWYVKWDTLHITFKDATTLEKELNSGDLDMVDWKRPASVNVYVVNDDGKTDYDKLIASTED